MATDILDGLTPAFAAEQLAELEAYEERERRGEHLNEEATRLGASLSAFTAGAWQVLEPGYVFKPNWHIDAIVEHLEAATRREITRLLINIPPGHMKSLNVSVLWPVWWWTFEPPIRFLTASYGEEISTRDAVKSRRLIQSAWYRARWGHVYKLAGDQNQKTRYENDRTGYRVSTSVGGTGTGERCDVAIIDDPLNAKKAASAVERQAVLDWHDQTIPTRLNEPERGVRVVIMQRLHEQDLSGHLIEHGGWTHLCLPAEYEPTHPFVWPDDPRGEEGELLWPEHVNAAALAGLKVEMGSYVAAGQLQQRPAPLEGGIFKLSGLRYFDPAFLEPPSPLAFRRIVQSWDTAFKEKQTSDYVVGALWGVAGANRYLLAVDRARRSLSDTKRAIRGLYAFAEATYPLLPHSVLIENTANGPDIIAALRDELAGIVAVTPAGDKVMRAHAVSPIWESGNVHVPGFARSDGMGYDPARTPGWVQEWIGEHTGFPNTAHDDQVDTTTQALIWLRAVKEDRPPPPPDDRERRAVTAGVRDMRF
jgi:predicted phage terminase large subunit-like protein